MVVYRGSAYQVTGVEGEGLFDPRPFGIDPWPISTACWRGYYCSYSMEGDELRLVDLHIGLAEEDAERARHGEGLVLGGVRPQYDERHESFVYAPLELPVAFTGGLLLGRGFITELYVHMGFQPGWKYREVHELLFEAGRLQQAFDRSAAMEAIRKSLKPTDLRPPQGAGKDELEAWIEETFSLRYKSG